MAIFEPAELATVDHAFRKTIALMIKLQTRITAREIQFLKIGLRASHIEEALVDGDVLRARAHQVALMKLLAQI